MTAYERNTAPESAAGWDDRIAIVEGIAAVAPDEIQDEADAYVQMVNDRAELQMVNDRAELSAANGYVHVEELPADARAAFIASHSDLQEQVNALIAYAQDNCDGL